MFNSINLYWWVEMTSKNDITGDLIKSKASNENYSNNWERIFGKKSLKKEFSDDLVEARNQVAIEGHIDKAFNAILKSNEPDAIHCYLVELAHQAVRIGYEAA